MANDPKSKTGFSRMVGAFDGVTGKVRGFFSSTIAELGRCSWPGRRELVESTLLVIVVICILGVFVAAVDELAMLAIRYVTTGK